jgi:hypothetical protein
MAFSPPVASRLLPVYRITLSARIFILDFRFWMVRLCSPQVLDWSIIE